MTHGRGAASARSTGHGPCLAAGAQPLAPGCRRLCPAARPWQAGRCRASSTAARARTDAGRCILQPIAHFCSQPCCSAGARHYGVILYAADWLHWDTPLRAEQRGDEPCCTQGGPGPPHPAQTVLLLAPAPALHLPPAPLLALAPALHLPPTLLLGSSWTAPRMVQRSRGAGCNPARASRPGGSYRMARGPPTARRRGRPAARPRGGASYQVCTHLNASHAASAGREGQERAPASLGPRRAPALGARRAAASTAEEQSACRSAPALGRARGGAGGRGARQRGSARGRGR